ncbi:MAG: beta-galactosidase [Thermoproteota archaeon]|nr:beta-galactosidase [Candidatus Brockarchaeota archaeon]
MVAVSYDEKSFKVNEKPLFIYSGEIHYFRIPKDLWEDRLIKIKRAFLNSVSVYFAWNWHEQEEGKFDFSGWKDLDTFLSLCEKNGLYIIARPGPYICAEWDFGGFPNWLIGKNVILRSLDEEFMKYALRYYDHIIPFIRKHLITNEGKVILFQVENEYFWGNVPYLLRLYEEAKKRGIDVPIVHNVDRYLRGTQVIDAIDLYPDPWSIEGPEKEAERLSEEQSDKPKAILELEGGWFSSFGGRFPTERGDFPAEWTDVLVKSLIFKGINAINFYMIHGGTNFGYWTGKNITSSYDYQAAIREWGELGERYWKIRLIGALIDSFQELFTSSDLDYSLASCDDKSLFVSSRTSKYGSLILIRNLEENEKDAKIKIKDYGEKFVRMGGKTALILPYKLKLPNNWILEFSTAQVFYSYELNGRTILILYGKEGEEHEVTLVHPFSNEKENIKFKIEEKDEFKLILDKFSDILVVALNEKRAARTWFVEHLSKKIAIISGFDLLRSYETQENKVIASIDFKKGDENLVNIIVPYKPNSITVNGEEFESSYDSKTWILSFNLPNFKFEEVKLNLTEDWKYEEEDIKKVKASKSWVGAKELAAPESLGVLKNGHIWYLGRFFIENKDNYKDGLTLLVPRVNDYVSVFFNGYFLGYAKHTGKFKVSNELIKSGENEVALLIESTGHRNDGILPVANGLNEPVFIGSMREEKLPLSKPLYKIVKYEELITQNLPMALDYSKFVNRPEEVAQLRKHFVDGWKELSEGEEINAGGIALIKYFVDIPRSRKEVTLRISFGTIQWGRVSVFVNSKHVSTIPLAEGSVSIRVTDYLKPDEKNEFMFLLEGGRLKLTEAPCLEFYDYAMKNEWNLHEGLLGEEKGWHLCEFDDSSWNIGSINNILSRSGIMWLRKDFSLEIPKDTISPIGLRVSSLGTKCKIYLNGVLIGRYMKIGPQTNFYLPESFLKEKNNIALVVENYEDSAKKEASIQLFQYYVAKKVNLSINF